MKANVLSSNASLWTMNYIETELSDFDVFVK